MENLNNKADIGINDLLEIKKMILDFYPGIPENLECEWCNGSGHMCPDCAGTGKFLPDSEESEIIINVLDYINKKLNKNKNNMENNFNNVIVKIDFKDRDNCKVEHIFGSVGEFYENDVQQFIETFAYQFNTSKYGHSWNIGCMGIYMDEGVFNIVVKDNGDWYCNG